MVVKVNKAIKVASYLKHVGSPTELIIGATGLSKEEVEKLQCKS